MFRPSAIHAPQSFPRLTRAALDKTLFLLAVLTLAAIAFMPRSDNANVQRTAAFGEATTR